MKTDFVKFAKSAKGEIEFYDSNTGNLLYSAPRGRSMDDFLKESKAHGWPSFRDSEVSGVTRAHMLRTYGYGLCSSIVISRYEQSHHKLIVFLCVLGVYFVSSTGELGICPMFTKW